MVQVAEGVNKLCDRIMEFNESIEAGGTKMGWSKKAEEE